MEKYFLRCLRRYLILFLLLFISSPYLFSQESLSEELTFQIERLENLSNNYAQQTIRLQTVEQQLQTSEQNLNQITESYQILYNDYMSLETACKRWRIVSGVTVTISLISTTTLILLLLRR